MITVKNLEKTYRSVEKTGNLIQDTLNRQYRNYTAVKQISFSIGENELVGFIGPNGAGKTTTLKMLSGILYPSGGDIDVLGFRPFEKRPEFLRQIGFIMGQKNQLIWDLPAVDTFEVNRAIYDIPPEQYRKTLSELSEMLEVSDYMNRPVKTLSLGQRMRCEFIAALIHRPKVLYLDEPTIGLDIFAQSTIRAFVKEYRERYRASIILTSHYMQDVEYLADRVILIDKGSIIYDDSLEQLRHGFSSYKLVRIVLSKRYSRLPALFSEYQAEYSHPVVTLTVERDMVTEVLSRALPLVEYRDFSVESESIEEVIKKQFSVV